AKLTGFAGFPLPQRLAAMASNVAGVWSRFGVSSATVNVIGSAPVTCQTSGGPVQISATDAPTYCPSGPAIEVAVGFFENQLEPVGDAGMLLAGSDAYGSHVLNFVGDLRPGTGLSAAQIATRDSCLSGVYFRSLQNQPGQVLNSADIDSVNKAML